MKRYQVWFYNGDGYIEFEEFDTHAQANVFRSSQEWDYVALTELVQDLQE